MSNDKNNLGGSIVFSTAYAAAAAARQKKKELEVMSKFGVADELRKLADLLKDGIISQAEFDTQKKKLLGEEKKTGWFGGKK
jgi:hypothetical protein